MRQRAGFTRIAITLLPPEERWRAVQVVKIETGRVVVSVLLEDRRTTQQVAIHPESPIPKVGLEPTPPLQGPDFESGASAIPPLRLHLPHKSIADSLSVVNPDRTSTGY